MLCASPVQPRWIALERHHNDILFLIGLFLNAVIEDYNHENVLVFIHIKIIILYNL